MPKLTKRLIDALQTDDAEAFVRDTFGNPDYPELGERYQGFLDAHAAAGVAAPAHPLAVHLTPQTAYETIRGFLTLTTPSTASSPRPTSSPWRRCAP